MQEKTIRISPRPVAGLWGTVSNSVATMSLMSMSSQAERQS